MRHLSLSSVALFISSVRLVSSVSNQNPPTFFFQATSFHAAFVFVYPVFDTIFQSFLTFVFKTAHFVKFWFTFCADLIAFSKVFYVRPNKIYFKKWHINGPNTTDMGDLEMDFGTVSGKTCEKLLGLGMDGKRYENTRKRYVISMCWRWKLWEHLYASKVKIFWMTHKRGSFHFFEYLTWRKLERLLCKAFCTQTSTILSSACPISKTFCRKSCSRDLGIRWSQWLQKPSLFELHYLVSSHLFDLLRQFIIKISAVF